MPCTFAYQADHGTAVGGPMLDDDMLYGCVSFQIAHNLFRYVRTCIGRALVPMSEHIYAA